MGASLTGCFIYDRSGKVATNTRYLNFLIRTLTSMKIGKLTIVFFKNIKLGSDFGKPTNRYYIRIWRRRISIHFWTYCLILQLKGVNKYYSGKPIPIEKFRDIMKARNIDLSNMKSVEISINGITEIDTNG